MIYKFPCSPPFWYRLCVMYFEDIILLPTHNTQPPILLPKLPPSIFQTITITKSHTPPPPLTYPILFYPIIFFYSISLKKREKTKKKQNKKREYQVMGKHVPKRECRVTNLFELAPAGRPVLIAGIPPPAPVLLPCELLV